MYLFIWTGIIHGLCELQALSWQEAEEVFLRGPTYHPRYACNLHLQKNFIITQYF